MTPLPHLRAATVAVALAAAAPPLAATVLDPASFRPPIEQRKNPGLAPGKKLPVERGKDYNHSTFCDLVISGLVGIRPRHDEAVVVNPLLPEGAWDWFCLDRVPCHGHELTVVWDRDGTKYGRGAGFSLLIDGRPAARRESLGRLEAQLPSAGADHAKP